MKYLVLLLVLALIPGIVPGQPRISSKEDGLSEKVTLILIKIEGNKKTRRSVILREMSAKEGDVLNSAGLEELTELNRKRIFNLSLFTDVAIEIDTLGSAEIMWTIKVKEQWYIWPEVSFKLADRNFNVWWKEQNHDIRRANIGVALKNRNFRGNLEQLSAIGQIGYTQKFGMEYYRPYVDKKQQHGMGASFFVAKNEETFYTTDSNKLKFIRTTGNYIIRQVEAAGLYIYRPGYAYKHVIELRYRDHRIDDTVAQLNPDYYEKKNTRLQMVEIAYRFDMNHVDNWNYPMEGTKAIGYSGMRIGTEGIKFQGFLHIEAGYFHKHSKKWFTSNIFRGRLTFPENQPYTYRYAMGYANEYLRGYEYYVIDGAQYGLLRNNLKYELVNVKIKNIPFRYLPVLPIRIYPKIYADIGYAEYRYPGNSYLNNRLLYGFGPGVDIVTSYDMKFRIEYSFNHLGEKGLFLHLSSE